MKASEIGKFIKENPKTSIAIGIGVIVVSVVVYNEIKWKSEFNQSAQQAIQVATKTPVPLCCATITATPPTCQSWLSKLTFKYL